MNAQLQIPVPVRASHPALSLVGVPYVRGGESPAEGFDCFTLLRYVRSRWFGVSTPVYGAMPSAALPGPQACALGIYRTLSAPPLAHELQLWRQSCAALPGDAVALGRNRYGRLHHCGVIVDDGVLHALAMPGVVWTPLSRIDQLYARVEFYECPC